MSIGKAASESSWLAKLHIASTDMPYADMPINES